MFNLLPMFLLQYFRLLVGAPKASTRQPGVTRGGAVYRCPVDSGSYCQVIPFDTKGKLNMILLFILKYILIEIIHKLYSYQASKICVIT